MLDNNYPPKARGAFYFLVSTRGIFFLSVTYVRLRLLLTFSKMLGNYCLGVELGHSETIIILTNGDRRF